MDFSKFFPRFQKFLTKTPYYTAEKTKTIITLKSKLTLNTKKAATCRGFFYDFK